MKVCKGTGKAKGAGCGKQDTHYKYGLCLTKNHCFQNWLHNSEEGQEMIIKKSKPINKVSKKRSIENKEYGKLRIAFLTGNPICQAQINKHCTNEATQVHHKKGRIGKLLTDTSNFLAVCYQCHNHIELNPKLAKELGFSKSRLAK